MIEVGTRVQWTDRSGVGTVTQIKRRTFAVAWDDQPATTVWEYEYYHLADSNADGFYIEVIPSEPVTSPVTLSTSLDRAAFYAGAVGAMEYRLADVYSSIARARECMLKHNLTGAEWHLTWVADRIENTAEKLANMSGPAGVANLEYLRDMIYRNRK